jgi:hypothetical protein
MKSAQRQIDNIGDVGMKQGKFLLLISILLAACAPVTATRAPSDAVSATPPDTVATNPSDETMPTNEPIENPLAPKPGDPKLTRGNVFIQEASLMVRESYPPQISLSLKGELPTPCNQLRVEFGQPTKDNKINVDVYSLVDPDLMCIQTTKPFDENVDLGTFPSGHYSVFVNGKPVGEFDS